MNCKLILGDFWRLLAFAPYPPPPLEEQGGDCPHDYLLIIARIA